MLERGRNLLPLGEEDVNFARCESGVTTRVLSTDCCKDVSMAQNSCFMVAEPLFVFLPTLDQSPEV